MAAWSYPLTRFSDGGLIREHLPIRCDSYTDALGITPGVLAGSLPLADGLDPDELLAPWRRVIWPTKNGQPQGAFVVTRLEPFGPRDTAVRFAAVCGARAKFMRTEIEADLSFSGVDQLEIARALVRYSLTNRKLPAPRAPWIELDSGLSGVLRDRLPNADGYAGAKHMKVSDALRNLGAVEGGFEYRMRYTAAGDRLVATLQLGYPRHGSTVPVMGLEHPGAVRDWAHALDATNASTYVRAYGQEVTSAAAVDTDALNEGWPLLMSSVSSTASRQDTLDGIARAALAASAGGTEGWAVVLGGDALGTYDLGDVVSLHIKHRRWPGGKRALLRILGHKVEPGRQGRAEKITLTVVPA